MIELEDLRDRALGWTVDIRHKRELAIVENRRPVGKLARPSFWQSLYAAELAGVAWRIKTVLRRSHWTDLVGFAEGDYGLGEGKRMARAYSAMIDGAGYRLTRDEERAVWRDENGFVVASFAYEANPRMELRWVKDGAIRVFAACPVSHAPVLALLGLFQIVYRGFFASSYGSVPNFDGLFGGGLDP